MNPRYKIQIHINVQNYEEEKSLILYFSFVKQICVPILSNTSFIKSNTKTKIQISNEKQTKGTTGWVTET